MSPIEYVKFTMHGSSLPCMTIELFLSRIYTITKYLQVTFDGKFVFRTAVIGRNSLPLQKSRCQYYIYRKFPKQSRLSKSEKKI